MKNKCLKWLLMSVIPGVLIGLLILFYDAEEVVSFDQICLEVNRAIAHLGVDFGTKHSYKYAVKKAKWAVVNISEKVEDKYLGNGVYLIENNPIKAKRKASLGSGVVVSSSGIILTNSHVVSGVERIVVTLKTGDEYDAQLVGQDPETDIAVLKIEKTSLQYIVLADEDSVEAGDIVLAIGNPFGLGQAVTSGVISAIGKNNLQINAYEDYIQTDAAINMGNSGGALINVYGELIGICTLLISKGGGNEGVSFVIPSRMAWFVMERLLKYGAVTRGWLGIKAELLTKSLAESYGLTSNTGTLVTHVIKDSPAYKSGLKRGDVLIAVDDENAYDGRNIMNNISEKMAGEIVALTIIRGDKNIVLNVTVSERPSK